MRYGRVSIAGDRMQGVGLIEVLVAMLVMLFGLLGLAGLLSRTHTAELESYQRKQAVILIEDMVGRITANRDAAGCYAKTNVASGTPFFGKDGTAATTCAAGTVTPPIPSSAQAARATADLGEWSTLLQGGSEVANSTNVGVAWNAKGCVINKATVAGQYIEYVVSVAWQGTTRLPLPADDSLCGKDSYGDDELRRVISTVVRIPVLN